MLEAGQNDLIEVGTKRLDWISVEPVLYMIIPLAMLKPVTLTETLKSS